MRVAPYTGERESERGPKDSTEEAEPADRKPGVSRKLEPRRLDARDPHRLDGPRHD